MSRFPKLPFDTREVAELRSRINLTQLLTPINFAEQEQRWKDLGKKPFNPQFEYDEGAMKASIAAIDELLASLEYLIDGKGYYDFLKDCNILVHHSFIKRSGELRQVRAILDSLIDDRMVRFEELMRKLYGDIQTHEVELAEMMIEKTPEAAFREGLDQEGREKREDFFKNYLNDFEGMFSKEERKELRRLEFDAAGIANYFRLILDYIREHATFNSQMAKEERKDPEYDVDIDSKYTAISVNAFSASGKSVIGIPASRKVSGLKLIELIGHELDCHYRSAMSTRSYFHSLFGIFGSGHPLVPLVPLLSHSVNETLSEGLAKMSDVKVLGRAGLPRPYQVLAINHARHGYNFEETMEYVIELYRQGKKSEDASLRGAFFHTYRVFRGWADTSSRCGLVSPQSKIYLSGFTTILNNLNWSEAVGSDESFLSLLRYSTLTLEEIDVLVCGRSRSMLGDNPYEKWDYGKVDYGLPNPVQYAASLLLN